MKPEIEGITLTRRERPSPRPRPPYQACLFADDLHAKRVASLANTEIGVLEGAAFRRRNGTTPRGCGEGQREAKSRGRCGARSGVAQDAMTTGTGAR